MYGFHLWLPLFPHFIFSSLLPMHYLPCTFNSLNIPWSLLPQDLCMHYFFSLERYLSIHTPLLTPLDPTSFTYLVPIQFQPAIKKLLALRSPTWSLPFNIYPIQTSLDFSVINFPETMFLSFRKGISVCSSTFLYVIICFSINHGFPRSWHGPDTLNDFKKCVNG